MTISIATTLQGNFDVNKCECPKLNGNYTIKFDLSTLTPDDVEQYLLAGLVIKYQGILRGPKAEENGLATKDTYIVPAPGRRIAANPVAKIEDQLAKLSPEAARAFLLRALAEQDALLEAGE